jgi:hypothetical protein
MFDTGCFANVVKKAPSPAFSRGITGEISADTINFCCFAKIEPTQLHEIGVIASVYI